MKMSSRFAWACYLHCAVSKTLVVVLPGLATFTVQYQAKLGNKIGNLQNLQKNSKLHHA